MQRFFVNFFQVERFGSHIHIFRIATKATAKASAAAAAAAAADVTATNASSATTEAAQRLLINCVTRVG